MNPNYNQVNVVKKRKPYSWTVIIILIFVFFPVSIFLIYKRFTYDKTATQKNSNGLRAMAFCFYGFALYYTTMGFTGNLETTDKSSVIGGVITMLMIFGGLGTFFLVSSMKYKRQGERYKKYIDIVVEQGQYDINNIAATAGVTYDTAIKDLRDMLADGCFAGAHLDISKRELVFYNVQTTDFTNTSQPETKVVACKGCGANNTAYIDRINACEYCGSSLN